MSDIFTFESEEASDNGDLPIDMCGCSKCGWKGKVSDCEMEQEQDGWESEPYMIHLCPICEDGGCIDDYWSSGVDK